MDYSFAAANLLEVTDNPSSSAATLTPHVLHVGLKNKLSLNSAAQVYDHLPERVHASNLVPLSHVTTPNDVVVANLEVEGELTHQLLANSSTKSLAGKVFVELPDSTSSLTTKLVWRVDGEEMTLLSDSDDSKLYSGDCYIFRYSCPGERGEEHIIGTWFGRQSIQS